MIDLKKLEGIREYIKKYAPKVLIVKDLRDLSEEEIKEILDYLEEEES